MTDENLTFYEPTEEQLAKFRQINAMSERHKTLQCVYYDDCSICPFAIHKWLLSTEAHHCTCGISEEEFRTLMSDADCEY